MRLTTTLLPFLLLSILASMIWSHAIPFTRPVAASDSQLETTAEPKLLARCASGSEEAIPWNRTYDGSGYDNLNSMVECTGGGFALAGYTTSWGVSNGSAWLVRTDPDGYALWSRTYDHGGYDEFHSVVECSEGGFALAGLSERGRENYLGWLVRTDADGIPLWNRTYVGPRGDFQVQSVVECDGGGFAFVGHSGSWGWGTGVAYFVRTDADGVPLWNCTYDNLGDDYLYSIVECASGGFAMAGTTWCQGYNDGAGWLVRTGSHGALFWNRVFDGPAHDQFNSLVECDGGGFALAGYTRSWNTDYGAGWLVRTGSDGFRLWNRTYGGDELDEFRSIVKCSGGFALAGFTCSGEVRSGAGWLVRTDADGFPLLSLACDGVRQDAFNSLVSCLAGGFALVGATDSSAVVGTAGWLLWTSGEPVPTSSPVFVILALGGLVSGLVATIAVAILLRRRRQRTRSESSSL